MNKEWGILDLAKEVYKQDGVLGLLSVAFLAFSAHQRDYIKARDREFGIKVNRGGCQMPIKHHCNGDYQVQIHHVIPQRYADLIGYFPDVVENGITLCEHSHQTMVHEDMRQARQEYGRNKNSFKDVFTRRKQKLDKGEIYWNATWDRQFHTTVARNQQRADKADWEKPQPPVKRPKKEVEVYAGT